MHVNPIAHEELNNIYCQAEYMRNWKLFLNVGSGGIEDVQPLITIPVVNAFDWLMNTKVTLRQVDG